MLRFGRGDRHAPEKNFERRTLNIERGFYLFKVRRWTFDVRRLFVWPRPRPFGRIATHLAGWETTSKRPPRVQLRLEIHPFLLVRGGVVPLHVPGDPFIHPPQPLDDDPHRVEGEYGQSQRRSGGRAALVLYSRGGWVSGRAGANRLHIPLAEPLILSV